MTSVTRPNLQLALAPCNNLHQRTSIAQTQLSTLNLRGKSNLLPLALLLTRSPDIRNQLITWLNWACESSLEFSNVLGVATTKSLQQTMAGKVEARESVHDGTSEAHLLSWLWGGVEWVVIAIESVAISSSPYRHNNQHACKSKPTQHSSDG